MNLSATERQSLHKLMDTYLDSSIVRKMKKYTQHGTISTYEHCKNVAITSFWLNRRLNLCADEKELVTGAVFHDFYLYDWHDDDPSHRFHGWSHPMKACENATQYFQINEKEQEIIKSHMWPFTLTRVPKSREAVIVCISDKYCSLIETLVCRRKQRFLLGSLLLGMRQKTVQ